MKPPFRSAATARRLTFLSAFFVAVWLLFAVRLFQIQVVDGARYAAQYDAETAIKQPIAATRGEILDVNRRPIAVNEPRYTVTLDYAYFPRGSSASAHADQNGILMRLVQTLRQTGEAWNDALPISHTAPYAFPADATRSVAHLKAFLSLPETASADDCLAALCTLFDLPDNLPAELRRDVAGIRYEMEQQGFSLSLPFTLASSVSKDAACRLGEMAVELPGVQVQLVPVRTYRSGTLAAHLIGSVGLLDEEEYAALRAEGYAYHDVIGKSGVERAMESTLRGKTGERTLLQDRTGAVIRELVRPPVPGDSVILTLDLTLQRSVERALDDIITHMRALPKGTEGQDIASGAAVVLDVRDNAVLACASWPTYNISTYFENYAELLADKDRPLFNRALDGGFAPGSTMKPAVAIAALHENLITRDSTFYCGSWYRFFEDQGLLIHCMADHGHTNVVTALGKSCNCFFCEMGRRLGIERMNATCRTLGLGVKTGIEVGESAGILAGPQERAADGGVWSPGDTAQAAIGQSDHMITPIQLAAYASTLARRGVRYRTHLVHSVLHADGSETVVPPAVAATLRVRPEVWDIVREGMRLTATDGTATRFFVGADYTFAAKTGTAEAGNGGSDHGVFIGYAPADQPQVAVAIVMENGTATASGQMARQVLDACFARHRADTTPTSAGKPAP
ncbi:MAG: hypothetical protein IKI63_01815 [Clostridia bacterium]|nr:hypothetical protein [Clostridia bacterium]